MDRKNRLGILVFFLLQLGILSKGKTMLPQSDSTSSDNNANSVNNAIGNSTTPSILVKTTINPTTNSVILLVNDAITTKHHFLAQKLDASKGTARSDINRTAGYQAANSRENGGLPVWAYILIGVIGVVILIALLCLAYNKFVRWKDHGTYLVWDEAELETSPAFTRESEFLLETSTGGQEMVSPELQLYEIPLDSVTHPRIAYIGSKRVAPKRLDDKTRKKDGEFNVPSLMRYKKRDTVYNSVTDTCMTSVMSEGTLNGDGSTSRHTLATVMMSNGGLDKYGSHSHHFENTTIKGIPRNKSHSMDNNRTQSVSNLIQSRPLPALPINKRFSKSLDKLRFFNTLPVIRPKSSHKLHIPEPSTYATLVKSASYGSNLQRTVNNSICLDPHMHSRKSSLDMQTKTSEKSTLSCHRKSKSLDTLTLLNEINWNALQVDVYHSYESVNVTKSENGEYASVSDSQPSSPYSDVSPQSPTKSNILTPEHTHDPESIYASLSQEDLQTKSDTGNVNEGNDIGYDSSTMSSLSRDSTCTSPYATIRISQIPGLTYDHDTHEGIYSTKTPEHSGGSLETPENSGSTINEMKPNPNSARSSTHTYLELFLEDSSRDSIISETSSGYARPVDVIKDIKINKDSDKEQQDKKASKRQSLSNVEIPIETGDLFDNEKNDLQDNCSIEPGGNEVYDNPVTVCDDERQKDELKNISDVETSRKEARIHDNSPMVRQISEEKHEFDEGGENVNVNEWPTRHRSLSEHSECEI